jgi:integrase
MKAGKEHRVPLSNRALAVLGEAQEPDSWVFPLGNMAMLELLRGLRPDVTVHGFRSSFRDWIAETTNTANIVAEMALAHSVGDKVEAAYRRGDLFEKRRKLMEGWAAYCSPPKSRQDNVTSLRRERVS